MSNKGDRKRGGQLSGQVPAFEPEFRSLLGLIAFQLGWSESDPSVGCFSGIDWLKWVRYLRGHRLGAFISEQAMAGVSQSVPGHVRELLRQDRYQAALFNLSCLNETAVVVEQLTAAGIPSLVLKGPLLGKRLFGAPGLRHSGDIDIWIDGSKLELAHRLISGMGYVPMDSIYDRSENYIRLYQRYQYHLPYSKERFSLEIHWRLFNIHSYFPLSFSSAFDRSKEVKIGENSVWTLNETDEFLYLCAHGAEHFYVRLFWLLDVVVAWIGFDDMMRSAVRDRALELRQERSLAFGIALGAEVFGLEDLRESLAEYELNLDGGVRFLLKTSERAYMALPPPSGERIVRDGVLMGIFRELILHRGWDYRWQAFSRHLLRVDEFSRWPLPRYLWFLYPAVRLCGWLSRRVGRIWRKSV